MQIETKSLEDIQTPHFRQDISLLEHPRGLRRGHLKQYVLIPFSF